MLAALRRTRPQFTNYRRVIESSCIQMGLEASNTAGDFFGHDGLCDLLAKTRGLSPALAADSIISSARQWSAKQDDDLTVLVCDYMPT
jgi:Stage II sporulation protein E (SpoIIE)